MRDEPLDRAWLQRVHAAKVLWADLTDADFDDLEASVEALYGMIQDRFGEPRESVAAKLETIYL